MWRGSARASGASRRLTLRRGRGLSLQAHARLPQPTRRGAARRVGGLGGAPEPPRLNLVLVRGLGDDLVVLGAGPRQELLRAGRQVIAVALVLGGVPQH